LPLSEVLKESHGITLDEWPDRSLIVRAEVQGPQLAISLESKNPPTGRSTVADVRVEVGEMSQVESRFQPKGFNWKSEFFEERGLIIYKFDVGEQIDLTKLSLAITSPSSLHQDQSILPSKLTIEKWDGEL